MLAMPPLRLCGSPAHAPWILLSLQRLPFNASLNIKFKVCLMGKEHGVLLTSALLATQGQPKP